MARYVGYKRPKNTKKTLLHLLKYLGMHKWSFTPPWWLCWYSSAPELILWELTF